MVYVYTYAAAKPGDQVRNSKKKQRKQPQPRQYTHVCMCSSYILFVLTNACLSLLETCAVQPKAGLEMILNFSCVATPTNSTMGKICQLPVRTPSQPLQYSSTKYRPWYILQWMLWYQARAWPNDQTGIPGTPTAARGPAYRDRTVAHRIIELLSRRFGLRRGPLGLLPPLLLAPGFRCRHPF